MVNRTVVRYRALALILALILAATWAAPVHAEYWIIECVDCPKSFYGMSDRSLVLDAAGHPHIAYGGDHLYYAWHDGTSWHYETADSSPIVGAYASLALDQEGYPHISFMDGQNQDLRYAYKDASGWHVEAAVSEGLVGYFTSLALDADGYPHVSYGHSWGGLYYAYKAGTWRRLCTAWKSRIRPWRWALTASLKLRTSLTKDSTVRAGIPRVGTTWNSTTDGSEEILFPW